MSLSAAGIQTFAGEIALLELPESATGTRSSAPAVGMWGVPPPLGLGVEAAGEVVEVGPGVAWPAFGSGAMTHPLPLRYQRCWAERLVAPAHLVAEKPDDASWAEAGAFPVPALNG